ncbi:hypothetical protein IWQ57_000457 [Coemansia nantahalensis]|uniref:Uncharacterized protein n=2 Tax=Coemansia TaxID=4863 RepID=A0ACC1LE97_9FUNG|nr:hypothetical protein IWQ57_000457 [Coemansia nantahalensis]KAJ2806351.1 hypothetical protein H4R21_000903 [Coemansia helicoidea]
MSKASKADAATASTLGISVQGALQLLEASSYPGRKSKMELIGFLEEYAAIANLTEVTSHFDQRENALAAEALEYHVGDICSDPLVQGRKKYAKAFRLLSDYVEGLSSYYDH